MRWQEILNRLTGFDTPVGGISWNPITPNVNIAGELIAFMEDRRVLFKATELEMPEHCILSVIEIRHYLTEKIQQLDRSNPLCDSLRAMRAACRKFMDTTESVYGSEMMPGGLYGYRAWEFMTALGELRAIFGIQLAKIATAYKLDIEGDLASILPADVNTPSGDHDGIGNASWHSRLFRRRWQ